MGLFSDWGTSKSKGIPEEKTVPPSVRTGGIKYGKSYKPKTSGGISYGEKNKPKTVGGISYKSKVPKLPKPSKPPKQVKPLFGESAPLTVSEQEMKESIKAEKKRIRDIEKEHERKQKAELKAAENRKKYVEKSQKAQQKSLKFNRKSPLARVIRKRIRKIF